MTTILAFILAASTCPALVDIPDAGACSLDDAGNPSCAPGEAEPDILAMTEPEQHATLCGHSTQAGRCHLDAAKRKKLFLAYSLKWPPQGDYKDAEIDHHIEESLGGSQSIRNLWPQRALPTPARYEKDRLESWLHLQFCKGTISLPAAHAILIGDWKKFYLQMKARNWRVEAMPTPEDPQ